MDVDDDNTGGVMRSQFCSVLMRQVFKVFAVVIPAKLFDSRVNFQDIDISQRY